MLLNTHTEIRQKQHKKMSHDALYARMLDRKPHLTLNFQFLCKLLFKLLQQKQLLKNRPKEKKINILEIPANETETRKSEAYF